jgi:large subunit ribosomal protein L11
MAVVNKINEATSPYEGVKIPVEVTLDTDTKEFSVKVGMLSTYSLITQALGISKGSSTPNRSAVGNLTFKQVVEIAERKREGLLANSLRAAVKEVLGTCLSMGVTVDGKSVKEVLSLLDSGVYDEFLKGAS